MEALVARASAVSAKLTDDTLNDDWDGIDIEEFDAVYITPASKVSERYPAKLHARSVAKQLDVDHGLIFLCGRSEELYEDSDQTYPFRQQRYFYYLSGVEYPGCALTYDIEGDILWLFTPPPRPITSVIFNGQVPTPKYFQNRSQIDKVCSTLDLAAHIKHYLACHIDGVVYGMQPSRIMGMSEVMQTRRDHKDGLDFTSLRPAMNAARALKSDYEVSQIRKANIIATSAHVSVLRSITQLKTEAEIEAIFAATCTSQDAPRQAYDIIAGSGHNASVLHYGANNEPLKGRQLVCLDAGCEWQCYASDVTRTFPISGEWSAEARKIHDLVTKMQDECIEMLRPGADYKLIHLHAHKVATQGLMDIGLLHKGSFAEIYLSGASLAFLPHGLGHYMGLEVHDYGGTGGRLLMKSVATSRNKPGAMPSTEDDLGAGYAIHDAVRPHVALRTLNPHIAADSILAAGHVVTVEPGIYFPKDIFQTFYLKHPRFGRYINAGLLENYYAVGGLRIEDDLLVTEHGYENLTTAPKGDEMLRIIREGWGGDAQAFQGVASEHNARGASGGLSKQDSGTRKAWW